MVFQILCVGKIKEAFYREEIKRLTGEVARHGNVLQIVEFPDIKIPGKLKNREPFLEKECAGMAGKIQPGDYVIALCIEGVEMTTKKHSEYIRRAKENGKNRIVYVIGGSLGLPEVVKRRADLKLSFSQMTFPHQIMRMVLCEEIKNAGNYLW